MRKFDVKIGDLGIEGRFESPAFSVLRQDGQRFFELLYVALAPFGMDLSNVTFGQTGTLADKNAYFALPALNGGVKLTVGRLEIGFNDINKINFEGIKNIINSVYGALESANVGARISSYTATLNVHGVVDGTAGHAFIEPFVARKPNGLGPSLGSGVVFYFGAHERRTNMAVVLDGSALVTDGLYSRMIITLDARRVRYQDLADAGKESITQAFGAVNLEPNGI